MYKISRYHAANRSVPVQVSFRKPPTVLCASMQVASQLNVKVGFHNYRQLVSWLTNSRPHSRPHSRPQYALQSALLPNSILVGSQKIEMTRWGLKHIHKIYLVYDSGTKVQKYNQQIFLTACASNHHILPLADVWILQHHITCPVICQFIITG